MLTIEHNMSFMRIRSCAVSRLVLQVLCAVTVRFVVGLLRKYLSLFTDLINDTYACENDKMLNDVLKREYGFQGYVMTDWSAQHSTESAIAGLDVRYVLHIPIPSLPVAYVDVYAGRYHFQFQYVLLRTKPDDLRSKWNYS